MRTKQFTKLLMASAAILATAGCGGGGSGVASTPTPPATPTPPPTPTPTPTPTATGTPLSAPPAGVTVTTNLASIGALHDVRWDAAAHAYVVSIGDYSGAVIKAGDAGPFGQAGTVVATDGSEAYGLLAWTGFGYTRFGHYYPRAGSGQQQGAFAFGVATLPGAVPTTGSASYAAQIDGWAYDSKGVVTWGLSGAASFTFDFAAGTLSGQMKPVLESAWDPPPTLPTYNFTGTVFSRGSTTFSGNFDVTGQTLGSFQGQFTGPNAEELMAGFSTPYFDTYLNGWGALQGVMAGKH